LPEGSDEYHKNVTTVHMQAQNRSGGVRSTIQNYLSTYVSTEVKTVAAGNSETPNRPATYYASPFHKLERPDSLC